MKWTKEEEAFLATLESSSLKEAELKFALKLKNLETGFTHERSRDAIRRKANRDKINIKGFDEKDLEEVIASIKVITDENRMARETNNIGIGVKEGRKILSVSDLHFPFTREDLLWAVIKEHADAEVLVINGDLVEGYAYSTFTKAKAVSAIAEYQAASLFVRQVARMFPKVVLVEGNHDARAAKFLYRLGIDKEQGPFLRPSIMGRLASGEVINDKGYVTSLEKQDNVLFDATEAWWAQVGKTIFAHPTAYKGGYPGGTVSGVANAFTQRFGSDYFDSVVVGHTHKSYTGVVGNHLLVEQGSFSSRMGYQYRDDLNHVHATNGYAVIYQDDQGNTDFQRSRAIYLGTELPPKKKLL